MDIFLQKAVAKKNSSRIVGYIFIANLLRWSVRKYDHGQQSQRSRFFYSFDFRWNIKYLHIIGKVVIMIEWNKWEFPFHEVNHLQTRISMSLTVANYAHLLSVERLESQHHFSFFPLSWYYWMSFMQRSYYFIVPIQLFLVNALQ